MKLLREKYKTYEGAAKRARFENGLARSEFNRGYKARVYRYTVVAEEDSTQGQTWRVQRES
jgi:hypothetical protein